MVSTSGDIKTACFLVGGWATSGDLSCDWRGTWESMENVVGVSPGVESAANSTSCGEAGSAGCMRVRIVIGKVRGGVADMF